MAYFTPYGSRLQGSTGNFDAKRAERDTQGSGLRTSASAVRSSHNGIFPANSLTGFKIAEHRDFADVYSTRIRRSLMRSNPNSVEEPLLRPSHSTNPRDTRSSAAPFSRPTIRASGVAWENRLKGKPVEVNSLTPVASRNNPGVCPALV